jgi:hypothetical protein
MDPNIVEHPGSLSEVAQSEPLEVVHPDDDERLYPEFVERWDMVETEGVMACLHNLIKLLKKGTRRTLTWGWMRMKRTRVDR